MGAVASVLAIGILPLVASAAATISAVNPTGVAAGSADTTITVTGTGFVLGSVVRLNGTNLSTTYVSSTQLTATVPAGELSNVASPQLTVYNPDGSSSNGVAFTVSATVGSQNPGLPNTGLAPTSSVNVGALLAALLATAGAMGALYLGARIFSR